MKKIDEKKTFKGVERYKTLACIIKNATLFNMSYEIIGNFDSSDIETILLNNGINFFGFYFMDEELQFFVHESIISDTRYIFPCEKSLIHSCIYECLQDAKKFINDNKTNLIDTL